MQKMIDEPMEILDIFGALKESKEEGEKEGIAKGVKAGKIIYSMQNDGKNDEDIIIKLVNELNITETEASELPVQYR